MPMGIWLLMSCDHNIVSKRGKRTAQLNGLISQKNRHVSYTTEKTYKLANLYHLGITTPSDTSIPTFMPSLHALGLYPYNPLIIQKIPLPVYVK